VIKAIVWLAGSQGDLSSCKLWALVSSLGQGGPPLNCAASQYATSQCKSVLFWLPSKRL